MKPVKPVDTTYLEHSGPEWRRALGFNIAGLRKAKGLSQLQLASRLCWPVSTLAKLERGELTPSEGQERDIAKWVNGK